MRSFFTIFFVFVWIDLVICFDLESLDDTLDKLYPWGRRRLSDSVQENIDGCKKLSNELSKKQKQKLTGRKADKWDDQVNSKAADVYKDIAKGEICALAEKVDKETLERIVKELNNKHDQMVPIREKVSKCLIWAADPNTDVQFVAETACYVRKFLEELNELFSEETQNLIKVHHDHLYKMIEVFKKVDCDFDNCKGDGQSKYKTIEVQWHEAVTNLSKRREELAKGERD